MGKNDNRILQYFSGMMCAKEKKSFEADLASDYNLNERFKEIKNKVSNIEALNKGIEIDDRYFNSILPNVRAKIDKKRPVFFQPKIIYSAASFVSALILFFVLLQNSVNNDFSLGEYEEELATLIDEWSTGKAAEDFFYESYSNNLSVNNFQSISDQVDLDLINELKENNILNSEISLINLSEPYEYIENLDEQELNIILNELSEIKIL